MKVFRSRRVVTPEGVRPATVHVRGEVIEAGHRTGDIATAGEKALGTREMADLVLARIGG